MNPANKYQLLKWGQRFFYVKSIFGYRVRWNPERIEVIADFGDVQVWEFSGEIWIVIIDGSGNGVSEYIHKTGTAFNWIYRQECIEFAEKYSLERLGKMWKETDYNQPLPGAF